MSPNDSCFLSGTLKVGAARSPSHIRWPRLVSLKAFRSHLESAIEDRFFVKSLVPPLAGPFRSFSLRATCFAACRQLGSTLFRGSSVRKVRSFLPMAAARAPSCALSLERHPNFALLASICLIFLKYIIRIKNKRAYLPTLLGSRTCQRHALATTGVEKDAGTQPEPAWVLHEHAVFRTGDRVIYACGEVATVAGIDEDGDLIVTKEGGHTATWFARKCTKTFTPGDRVGYPGGDVAEVVTLDADGDLVVRCQDGRQATWYTQKSSRLLSIGDRVQYVCGAIGTVIGFDSDNDVEVEAAGGRKAVWFRSRCMRCMAPL